MVDVELNQRKIDILQKLRRRKDFIKVEDLAKEYKVTNRTIRYDLDKIEEFLVKNGFHYLQKEHKKGVKLSKSKRIEEFIDKFINSKTPYRYFYSKDERFKVMIVKLLQSSDPLSISYFEKLLYISRNTVLKELDLIEMWLKNRGLELIRKPRVGIFIDGEEINKRKAIIEVTSESISIEDIYSYINQKMAQNKINSLQFDVLFSEIDINFLNDLILYSEIQLKREFSDRAYSNLLTHLALMIKRILLQKHIYLPDLNEESLEESKEYFVAKEIIKRIEGKYKIEVPEVEIYYISIHLLGAKTLKYNGVLEDDLYEVAKKMTEGIEEIYNVSFENKNKIIIGLVVHLRPAIYRIKYNLKLSNPLYNEIINNYRDLFLNTKLVIRNLEKYIGTKISNQEIAYITLHFGAALEYASESKVNRTRVIVVCGTGIGTSNMIASQLEKEFDIEIVDTVSSRNIKEIEKSKYDLIISTVDIPEIEGNTFIKISPLLLKGDYEKLKSTLVSKSNFSNHYDDTLINRLLRVVEKYCDIKDRLQLEYEFMYELKASKHEIHQKGKVYMLNDLLKRDVINLNVSCNDWKQAIDKSTHLLIAKGYIEESYREAIYDNFKEMGPYMVVGPGIVLAHARPENGVNKLCMSLITLKEPVDFGHKENDPIKLVITFAAQDNESHLKALSQLMELLMNTEDLETIMNCKDKERVLSIIRKYSSNSE
nr:BglG family transcription antiterminator [Sporosalibacterium faouarense]